LDRSRRAVTPGHDRFIRLKLKGVLFLALGLVSSGMIIALSPTLSTVVLLMISNWAFSRFYYFAFYVLHHYADPDFNYSGLLALSRYLLRKKED